MSSEETMQFQPTGSLDTAHEMLLKISSAKQFALGALVIAQNALANTYVQDSSATDQLNQLQNVIKFLNQSMTGAFEGVNDIIEEAKTKNDLSGSIPPVELDNISS